MRAAINCPEADEHPAGQSFRGAISEPEEPEEGIDESQAVNSRSLFNNKTLDIYIHSSSVPTQVSLKEAYKRKLDKLVAHQRELTAKMGAILMIGPFWYRYIIERSMIWRGGNPYKWGLLINESRTKHSQKYSMRHFVPGGLFVNGC